MIPTHQTKLAAGADVYAAESVIIPAQGYELIKTGAFVPDEMPDDHHLELVPRSSLCLKQCLDMPNSHGIIDKDYKLEILVPLRNLGSKPVSIKKGERIAQLICMKHIKVFPVIDADRNGGFGSTNND